MTPSEQAAAVERALRNEICCRDCDAWKTPEKFMDRARRLCWRCYDRMRFGDKRQARERKMLRAPIQSLYGLPATI